MEPDPGGPKTCGSCGSGSPTQHSPKQDAANDFKARQKEHSKFSKAFHKLLRWQYLRDIVKVRVADDKNFQFIFQTKMLAMILKPTKHGTENFQKHSNDC
jgi:hypothetical protein